MAIQVAEESMDEDSKDSNEDAHHAFGAVNNMVAVDSGSMELHDHEHDANTIYSSEGLQSHDQVHAATNRQLFSYEQALDVINSWSKPVHAGFGHVNANQARQARAITQGLAEMDAAADAVSVRVMPHIEDDEASASHSSSEEVRREVAHRATKGRPDAEDSFSEDSTELMEQPVPKEPHYRRAMTAGTLQQEEKHNEAGYIDVDELAQNHRQTKGALSQHSDRLFKQTVNDQVALQRGMMDDIVEDILVNADK